MSMWFYAKAEIQLGPVATEELKAMAASGEVLGDDLVWREGMTGWLPIYQVPELNVTGPPSLRNGLGGNVPLPQPPAYSVVPYPSKIPTYFGFSIAAIVLGLFSFCFIGLPFGIVAIVYSTKVESLRMTGQTPAAESASKSAKIWMTISLGFSILPWLAILAFSAFTEVSQS